MRKKLTLKEKRLDMDLAIIGVVTLIIFGIYAVYGKQILDYVTNTDINVLPRLLLIGGIQFGIAGLGIVIVLILRKETLCQFGLCGKNFLRAIIGTVISFIPLIAAVFASGSFKGYEPFSRVIIRDDVLSGSFPINVIGMVLIALTWGFFEGINYAVISDKINQRYPAGGTWKNYGAIVCAIICLLFHPINTSFWGIIEMITTFIAIYGMLIVKHETKNAWGIVLAFCFIWNAI